MSSPYMLESVLGLLGVAILYMAFLLRAESKASPTDPLLIHNVSISDGMARSEKRARTALSLFS
jgi:hypothetical protein